MLKIIHTFLFTDDALASLDIKVVGKWRKYFQLKADFYLAYVSILLICFYA